MPDHHRHVGPLSGTLYIPYFQAEINILSLLEDKLECINDARAVESAIARNGDGTVNFAVKTLVDGKRLIICQSNADAEDIREIWPGAEVNPLGYWTGGTNVDTGATNRKLGSDMADSVTGGGLHGKDLSKADVSVNIYAWLKAQQARVPVEFCCAIGDDTIDDIPYAKVVQIAKNFINWIGGFERFAEWGLV